MAAVAFGIETLINRIRYSGWRLALVAMSLSITGCDVAAPPATYVVVYAAEGTPKGMLVTISTPIGTEQHQVGHYWTSTAYTFRAGQHAYISAQNLGDRGKLTVSLVHGELGKEPVKLQSFASGAGSIASLSLVLGTR